MGCTHRRPEYSNPTWENQQLSQAERACVITRRSLPDVESKTRRLIITPGKSRTMLDSFNSALDLSLHASELQPLAKAVSNADDTLNGSLLLVWAILCSHASEQNKAEALWHIADSSYSNTATIEQLRPVITWAIQASYKASSQLALSKTDNENRLKVWIQNMIDRENECVETMLKSILKSKTQVAKEKFMRRVLSDDSKAPIGDLFKIRCFLERTEVRLAKHANPFRRNAPKANVPAQEEFKQQLNTQLEYI